MELLARTYSFIGRFSDAIVMCEQLLENAKICLEPDDPVLLDCMNRLATAYRRAGHWQQAKLLLEQIVTKVEALRGPTVAGASLYAQKLAMIYLDAGLYSESIARFEQTFACRIRLGSSPDPLMSMDEYFLSYQRAGRLDEADRLLRRRLELLRKRGDSRGQISQVRTLEMLSLNLLLQNRPAEAESLAREALTLYEKNHPTDREWRLPYVMNLLGGTLLGQKKYAEVEPLLVQGYEGMKQGEATMTAQWRFRLTEAGERVIRYYEQTNQPEKAREWREKLKPAPHLGP
jgi:tetratricopeptide (TPR) repeat protein